MLICIWSIKIIAFIIYDNVLLSNLLSLSWCIGLKAAAYWWSEIINSTGALFRRWHMPFSIPYLPENHMWSRDSECSGIHMFEFLCIKLISFMVLSIYGSRYSWKSFKLQLITHFKCLSRNFSYDFLTHN